MMSPISRKENLIAEGDQQRLELVEEAELLKVGVHALTQRTQNYALLALVTVGVSFGIWLAMRAKGKSTS